MPQPVVSVYDYLTTAQIADAKAGTATLDLTAPLNTALASGNAIYVPAGTYRHDGPLVLPLTTMTVLYGDGYSTEFRAGAAMQYQMSKGTLADGANSAPVFIDNVLLNANRMADVALRIGRSKGGRLHNVKACSFLVGGFRFGNDNGDSSAAYYENECTKLTADGDAAYHPGSSPLYGLLFNEGATDNLVTVPVVSYLDLANGVGLENKGAANVFVGCHSYGAAYNIRASVFCQIVAPYSDSMAVAGIKIAGDGITIDGGMCYWPVGFPPAVGGAVPFEVASGVAIVSITGGVVRNDNSANPYVRCLGARPARLNVTGLTPARNPLTNLTGDRTAHIYENSIGVRAPSSYVTAAIDIAGPLFGRAQVQYAKNDVLRYMLGTDNTNATGSGDTNENFELRAVLDDLSVFQALRWVRGSKTWYLNDSALLGTAAGKLGFYGTAPVAKQTGTPANATDLATVIALTNNLRAKLISLGLIA